MSRRMVERMPSIEDGLRRALGDRGVDQRRTLLPVSEASGGLRPGLDLTATAALQEMDDLEQVERLRKPPFNPA